MNHKLKSILSNLNFRPSSALRQDFKKILSVEGQISPNECSLLFDLASRVSTACIVEVGSYRGRSTAVLALASLMNSKVPVYAIEPHEEFKGTLGGQFGPEDRREFFKNMLQMGVVEIVRLVNLSSEVVCKGWNRDIAFLWLDGDHTYEGVKRDFECWEPFVVHNGLIAFHDSIDPNLGPSKVIAEAISSGTYTQLRQVDLTRVLRKVS